jgi:hypothetical protein
LSYWRINLPPSLPLNLLFLEECSREQTRRKS